MDTNLPPSKPLQRVVIALTLFVVVLMLFTAWKRDAQRAREWRDLMELNDIKP